MISTAPLAAYVGQAVEMEDINAKDQCMDEAFLWCDLNGIPRAAIRNGYAFQVWSNYLPAYLEKVSGPPQEGDFAIWNTQVGFAGHIAVVKATTANGFISYDQNWEGVQVVREVSHNYFGVSGFLRIKQGGQQVNPTQKQVSDVFAQFNFTAPTQDQINYYAARDIRVLFLDILMATKPSAADVVTAFKNQGLTPTQGQIDFYMQYIASRMYKDLNAVAQTQGTVAEQKKQIDELIKKAEQAGSTGGFTDADRVVAQSTNSIVKQILDKITSIFK